MIIKFSVNGTPAPKGSATRGHHGQIYADNHTRLKPWTEAVRAETQRAAAEAPLWGPVAVLLGFRLTRPRGHYGTGRNADQVRGGAPAYPHGKPDVDKLARAVLDGLKAGGAYHDDAQVVTLACAKGYADIAGVDIEISEVQP